MRPDAVMIFAAGFGKRMRPLTDRLPKPLIELGGRTLLDRTRDLATAAGLTRQVVNAHHLADAIESHLAGSGVAVSREDTEILDTGGGLKAALPLFRRDWLVTANPDVLWLGPNPFETLLSGDAGAKAGAVLLLVPVARARGRVGPGDFDLTADGTLVRGSAYVYGGVQAIWSGAVARHPGHVFSLNAVWDALAAEGRLTGVIYPGFWCDTGTMPGLETARELLLERGNA